ncbi:MAG: ABC transporter substrate-binding protein [Chloroflexota bacterium]|nr:extracellular solute-binding protein [Caldilinea sp.]GIK72997.1 MAG: ABC transporter substrate-binding protein [Chloroflexota bacterium]
MRKLSLSLAMLVVMAMLLAACGGGAAPADTGAAPDAAADAPVAEAPAAEPTPVINNFGQCDDPLILWHGLTGSDGAVFAELLQQFSDANPDVCLNSEGYPWDIFFQKYPTAVAAGTPPDLVIFHAAEVNQMANEGLMLPLDDIMFADGTFSADDFNETLMAQLTVNGQIMAVPFDNHGWLLWYNTKLMEDAGLDPNVLPANGAEFIEMAQKLTKDINGKHPNEEGFDKDNVDVWAIDYTWPRYTIPTTLWQFGGAVVGPDGKTATLDSPESIAAVQFWHDLMYKYYVAPPAVPGKMWAGDLYKNNKLVFMWEGTWTGGFMRDNPDVAALTKTAFINSLAPDGNQAVKFDSHIFSIPTGVDQAGIDKAKKLMVFLVENGAYWATSGQVPALKSVQALPEVQSIPSVAMAAEQFNAIGRTDTSHKAFIEIQTAWETAVGNALASPDADVAAALRAGNEQVQAILDRP